MAGNPINEYPYWGPGNSGPAKNFAYPSEPIADPQLRGIEEDSFRLRVPQETMESNFYTDVWQWNEIIIPTPQAPVTVPDQIVRADSLMSYAEMTLAGSMVALPNSQLGNAGQKNVTNG